MRWKFLSNGTGIFLAPKTGTGLSCTIYEMPVKFSLSQDMKPDTIHPMVQKNFDRFGKKREKGNDSKGITFFRKISTGMSRSCKWRALLDSD